MVENSQAQITCVAEGVPQPSLSWEKEGTPLSDTSGEYTILPSGELVIDVAQVRDHSRRPGLRSHIMDGRAERSELSTNF